ncbi:c-type cytochrome [Urbifossiella limnaea]|uniref:Cytochrome c n=1 Tax=Urbifossiella limnaea TaxID=2528023 RepID=A0A517XNE0_9BACT|nr:c-type cytochrome [Urbifossiella limnaea]QDU19025.1 Cytochrome c [Urbifossiella limnaea]
MKPFGSALLAVAAVAVAASPAAAAPVVPGLSNTHPLTEPQVGRLLMSELRCAACHGGKDTAPAIDRSAPDLSDVGARVAPDYLRRFLAAPAAAHPGTPMPDLLAAEPAGQRERIAEALTHFLVAQSPGKFTRQPFADRDPTAGKALFHSVGCVVCHSPRDDAGKEVAAEAVVGLGHVPEKYSHPSLRGFLREPTRVRPSGRMPDMKLTPAEADAVAAYLVGATATKVAALEPRADLVALGKEHFRRLNCAACHTLGGVPPAPPVRPLDGADAARGCLSDQPGKAPRFGLSAAQAKAVRAALAAPAAPASDKDRLATTLVAFNCVGCHKRDNYGGVSEGLDEFFRASEKELGDEGRIPPPLTLVGAKLQRVAMQKVLFDGDGVRPYMTTRMPQFGEPNLRHLPDLFAALDTVKGVEFRLPRAEGGDQQERDRERVMRAAGRDLVGDQGLNCIACHSFNGKAPNREGIELLTSTQRLQPAWFYQFLRDPSAFRPRTVMPTSWPGGKAVHTKILDGDTDRQIESIWYYLSLGTSAADPSGMRSADTLLTVTDAARTYRGRSSVAGYRGIAVGFPDKLNYAFNAETGTLSALWRGDFVRVNRGGQGSGGFNPAAKAVQLAQDLSFYALADERAAWPLRPVTNKDVPANPDPLYAKNGGYQFKGYQLDAAAVPTFLYRTGDVEVGDRSAAENPDEKPRLVRQLSFDSPAARTVWFRALTGKVEAESKVVFKTPDLRVGVPPVPFVLRPTAADPRAKELLLRLDIPAGRSTRTLTYDILP